MNEYIVTKRFKSNAICGELNLKYGTNCNLVGDYITCDKGTICTITSQNAYDFFARNDDNKGLRRGKLIKDIKKILGQTSDPKHQERWDRIWEDKTLAKYNKYQDMEMLDENGNLKDEENGNEHSPDFWLWNFAFYNAPIRDLEYIFNLIKD